MRNNDDDRRKEDTREESVSEKLAKVADEKQAEDANKVEQPDPTAGYEVGDKDPSSERDVLNGGEERVIPIAQSDTVGGADGTTFSSTAAGIPVGTPPIITRDEDGVEARPVIDVLDDEEDEEELKE